MERKSPKEIAFLKDLYVATDWGERFAELVDEHVELPAEGTAVYVAAGTGSHAMSLQERAETKLRFVFTDENEECLELARAKAIAMNQEAEFKRAESHSLGFDDEVFDLVLGDVSLVPPDYAQKIVDELVRVARPGAIVAFWLPTASS